MSSIAEKLDEIEEVLRANDVADPRREAALLLSYAIGRDKTFLIAHPEYVLSPSEVEQVDALVSRRASREPFQYIAGRTEFFGLEFVVTPDVLIPRPETEMVVESALELLGADSHERFCEIGIGSGCIAVSVLHSLPQTSAIGLDVSTKALRVARLNSEKHGVAERLNLLESDVYSALRNERFSLILSNPPYVPAGDSDGLQAEVRNYEPHIALFAGSDGLSVVRQIVTGAPEFLVPGGILLMEIGFAQSARVVQMFPSDVWYSVDVLPDLQGIPRLVKARLR